MKKVKKYIPVLVFSLVALVSCQKEDKPIQGNGLVNRELRQVDEFTEMHVDGIINLFLRRGETQLVEVESDENLQELIEVTCLDGKLSINVKSDVNFEATEMNAYIRTPKVDKITLRGITNLTTENTFRQTSLTIDKDNTGKLLLNGEIEYLWLDSYGIGDVVLRGKSERATINFAPMGNLEASEFKTETLELRKAGTGTANVWVERSLNLTLEGVGDVYCKGNPAIIEKDITGIGRLLMIVE